MVNNTLWQVSDYEWIHNFQPANNEYKYNLLQELAQFLKK